MGLQDQINALRVDVFKLRKHIANVVINGTTNPAAHATTHQSGGTDPIKLDDLSAPDDNTDLDASAVKHGLMPKWTAALISALLDLISTTRGAILYRGLASWSALNPGATAGHVLTSNGTGADPSYQATGSGYTDEQAQDAVGTILTDTATIDFTYTDATPSITADVKAASITEAMQVLADNTTQDVSITKHGYAPKAPNDATKYLDGTGAYTVPSGSGAPTGAQYLVLSLDGTLSAERRLVLGSGLVGSDSGANGNYTVSATGGGSSTSDPDAVPASPSSYDDEFLTGSLDAKWTWNNQGSASISFQSGYAVLQDTAAAANALRSILQTIGGGDTGAWTITASLSGVFGGAPSVGGICLTDGTKFEIFDQSWPTTSGDQPLRLHTSTNNASALTLIASWQAAMRGYLRIQRTGSNHVYSFSPDGRGYVTLLTRSATAFLAAGGATKFGLFVWTGTGTTSGVVAATSVDYFRVTLP